jgi:hypothetical protein
MKKPGPVYKRISKFQSHTTLGRHASTIRGGMGAYESMAKYSTEEIKTAMEENMPLKQSLSSFNREAREVDPDHREITT